MLNEKMLTVEDCNSVIKHFGKGFVDYYEIDTRLLTTADTWFAWDFIDVYRVAGSISFSVRNSLWTGGYKILNSNISSPTVSVSNGTITVSGTGLEWVVLLLELSPEFKHSSIFQLAYEVEYTPCIRPFYDAPSLTMGFLNGETPVTGLSVTDKITGDSLTTDSDGLVTVTADLDAKGEYDYCLEAVNNSKTVDYNFPYQLIQAELPVILVNPVVYRDKVNRLTFQFLFDDEYPITYNHLFTGNIIRLILDGKSYTLDVDESIEDESFWFDVPIGSGEFVDLRLEITGNSYIDNYNVDMSVATSYVMVDSATSLNTELSSDYPASTIVFGGDELTSAVSVNSDVTIRFTDDVVSSLDNVFTVTGASLTLDGVNFEGKGLVNLNNGNLNIVNGSLQHCTATIVKGTGDLTVDVCTFTDNASCIDVIGNVSLSNTLFDLADEDYLDTSTPAFIRCTDNLIVDYCDFNLELSGLTTLGLSYVMLLLGKNGSVNSILNNTLFSNDVFPVAHNTGNVDVTSTNYHFTSKGNKCVIWSIEDSNTVYYNNLNVEYIGGE